MDSSNNSRKNTREYFLEFLMLFAAVTLGFFAENQREAIGEKERGVQYAMRLIEDLDLDSIRLVEVMDNYDQKIKQINALIPLMQGAMPAAAFYDSLYDFFTLPSYRAIVVGVNFVENLATRDELKAGNMRLIRSDSIVRRISLYTRREAIFMANQSRYRDKRSQIIDLVEEIYDMPQLAMERMKGEKEHKVIILNKDPQKVRTLVNYIVHLQGMIHNLQSNIAAMRLERWVLKNHLKAYIVNNS